jgi:hypothetical protein
MSADLATYEAVRYQNNNPELSKDGWGLF